MTLDLFRNSLLLWNLYTHMKLFCGVSGLCDMLFANTHKFINEARRLHSVTFDLQITYHKDFTAKSF